MYKVLVTIVKILNSAEKWLHRTQPAKKVGDIMSMFEKKKTIVKTTPTPRRQPATRKTTLTEHEDQRKQP